MNDPCLPTGDRIAHLLLALRTDEQGFATVANQAFAGAPWRVRRRLPAELREALRRCRRLDTASNVRGRHIGREGVARARADRGGS